MAKTNTFEGICYKCGAVTPKNKGFSEKTNHAHHRIGINSQWVIRCKKCVGEQFTPARVIRHIKPLFCNIDMSRMTYSIWFDNKHLAHLQLKYKLRGKEYRLSTSLAHNDSNQVDKKNQCLISTISRIHQQSVTPTANN